MTAAPILYYQATYPDGTSEVRAFDTPQNVGKGAAGDLQYMTAIAGPVLSPDQVLAQKLAAGLAITSTATPALNGTYAIDDTAQRFISGTAAGIAARNRLPGGGSTFGFGDITGAPHNFSAADFLNLADACEDYVYQLYVTARTLAAGGQAAWPPAAATIA